MSRGLALYAALVLSALLGLLVPFVGPTFGITLDSQVAARIADHAVPGGVAMLAGCALAALEIRTGRRSTLLAFTAFLGGLWMVGSHLPLVMQSLRGGVTWAATSFHSVPGVLVAGSAAVILGRSLVHAEPSPS
ncbi:hypothetical protein BH24ACT26_BH24ACT26_02500 [soil metagenome]